MDVTGFDDQMKTEFGLYIGRRLFIPEWFVNDRQQKSSRHKSALFEVGQIYTEIYPVHNFIFQHSRFMPLTGSLTWKDWKEAYTYKLIDGILDRKGYVVGAWIVK